MKEPLPILCQICGEDLNTPGQWLACRGHFTERIRELEQRLKATERERDMERPYWDSALAVADGWEKRAESAEQRVERHKETVRKAIKVAESYAQDCTWYSGKVPAHLDALTHEAHSHAHDACHVALEIADAIHTLADEHDMSSEEPCGIKHSNVGTYCFCHRRRDHSGSHSCVPDGKSFSEEQLRELIDLPLSGDE